MLHHESSVSDQIFWSAVSLALPGPEASMDSIEFAREVYADSWPAIQIRFVIAAAQLTGLHDWGVLGLDAEAARRVRVIIQMADEYALDPALEWPPALEGTALAPHDCLYVGRVIAERTGIETKMPAYIEWNMKGWLPEFLPLLGLADGDPNSLVLVDDRIRREVVGGLDAAVEVWAMNGTLLDPGPEMWSVLGDDGTDAFLRSDGLSVFSHGDIVEAQLKGAVRQARGIGAPDIVGRAQWLAALRLALRGEMALRAARTFVDHRPWAHDALVELAREFLS